MNFEQLTRDLADYTPGDVLFLALGNENRGDDAAGLELAQLLRHTGQFRCAHTIFVHTNPENHLQQILDFSPALVVCIDTAHRGLPPGSIEWIDPQQLDTARSGTHAFSITLIAEYINHYKTIPFRYLGIEPLQTRLGAGLSFQVTQALYDFFKSDNRCLVA